MIHSFPPTSFQTPSNPTVNSSPPPAAAFASSATITRPQGPYVDLRSGRKPVKEPFKSTDLRVKENPKAINEISSNEFIQIKKTYEILSSPNRSKKAKIQIEGDAAFKAIVLESIAKLLTRPTSRRLILQLMNGVKTIKIKKGTDDFFDNFTDSVSLKGVKSWVIAENQSGIRHSSEQPVFMILAHELIHASHDFIDHTYDQDYDNLEERITIDGPGISENTVRREFGLKRRWSHGGGNDLHGYPSLGKMIHALLGRIDGDIPLVGHGKKSRTDLIQYIEKHPSKLFSEQDCLSMLFLRTNHADLRDLSKAEMWLNRISPQTSPLYVKWCLHLARLFYSSNDFAKCKELFERIPSSLMGSMDFSVQDTYDELYLELVDRGIVNAFKSPKSQESDDEELLQQADSTLASLQETIRELDSHSPASSTDVSLQSDDWMEEINRIESSLNEEIKRQLQNSPSLENR